MATGDSSSAGSGDAKPKVKVSPARNVIATILFVVIAGAAILEFVANLSYRSAVSKLETRLDTKDSKGNAQFPTLVEAEKLIGKSPAGPVVIEGHNRKATYKWQGLRKYVLTVFYSNEKDPKLVQIQTD